jgi:hypothetical protein
MSALLPSPEAAFCHESGAVFFALYHKSAEMVIIGGAAWETGKTGISLLKTGKEKKIKKLT